MTTWGLHGALAHPPAELQLEFLSYVQAILAAEARWDTTYKPALLIALGGYAIRKRRGPEPLEVDLRELSEDVIALYWQQCMPPAGLRKRLQQRRAVSEAAIPERVAALRSKHKTLSKARASKDWGPAVTRVRSLLVGNPIPRLQTLGSGSAKQFDLLYDTEDPKTLVLRWGIAECFARFFPLIRSAAQAAWLRRIRKWNEDRIEGLKVDLHEFMFEGDRSSLTKVKDILVRLYGERCFYCDEERSDLHVDHFIPYAIYNQDLGLNFVLACPPCNNDKSAALPDARLLRRWLDRIDPEAPMAKELRTQLRAINMPREFHDTKMVALWAYERFVGQSGDVWTRKRRGDDVDRDWKRPLGVH